MSPTEPYGITPRRHKVSLCPTAVPPIIAYYLIPNPPPKKRKRRNLNFQRRSFILTMT